MQSSDKNSTIEKNPPNNPATGQKNQWWKTTLLTVSVIGCGVLGALLYQQQQTNQKTTLQLNQQLASLKEQLSHQKQQTQSAQAAATQAQAAQKKAESSEKKLQKQLVSLGVTNDHLIAWMMRDHSQELPELQKSSTARDAIMSELEQFLKLTEDNNQFQPIRARIMLQLAELEIHKRHPAKADKLLDAASKAWEESQSKEPGHSYRIARARLACLIEASELGQNELAQKLLPKARKAAQNSPQNKEVDNKRLQAIIHAINGRMLQKEDPEKALKNFESAIEDMKGIQRTLTEHIIVRSDLARYSVEAASLAESLNHRNEAEKLRNQAIKWLKELLKTNPKLPFANIQLAHIHILSASSAINMGKDKEAAASLSKAEELLKNMPTDDLSLNGAPMQIAKAKGLRAILLRDAGKHTEAKKLFLEAIETTKQIVDHQDEQPNGSNEALYQLALLHWQYAGMVGDKGDKKSELAEGKQASEIMEKLLKKGAGVYDIGIRRALGYLYGDLGHTAAQKGDKALAAKYYKRASLTWQSLIEKYGKEQEYADGLKWSQARYKQVGGK